jgi:hypothetical protein
MDESSSEIVSPRAKALALKTIAVGTGTYLLLAAAVDAGVVGMPEGNRFLHTLILTLLGLAFVLAAEGFLALIRAISPTEMLEWPFRAAAVGSVTYSLAYGHRVFVNCWYWDDWGYLYLGTVRLDYSFITWPINDHFVPLLKILLWGMVRVFGIDFIGAACLQQIAFLMIVLAFAHLLWSATRRPWLLILLVGLFGMWPSYGVARTWFGGGFWLTASAALLAVYVLHTRRIMCGQSMRLTDVAVSGVLAAATVFISSQTLVPAVYLLAFCAPAVLMSQRRVVDVRRLGILCAISLAPTVVALWGRSVYVVRPPLDPSGLFDGRIFTNLGAFILNKVLFASSFNGWWPLIVVAVLLVLPLATATKELAASKIIDPSRRAELAGLMLGGCAVFFLPVIQIGLGRGWSYDAVINPYYVTMPFLGLWLAWAAVSLTLSRRPDGASIRLTWSVSVAISAVIGAAGLSAAVSSWPPAGWRAMQTFPRKELPLTQRVQLIHAQQEFINDLGAAISDLARLHRDGPAVHWVPNFEISKCRACESIIGPTQFLHDIGFDWIARIAARRTGADMRVLSAAAVVTDGRESKAALSFVQKYLVPLDLTTKPPEISAAMVQIRGKSALDSLNGAVGSSENGTRSIAVTGRTITSCDGWAFDDLTKTAPEHVWIELTNPETGIRHYWPAHRYSRPTFSTGLKMPSTIWSGISCEAVPYALPVGVYTMKVYQVEGKTAIVSDFSTLSISPTISVK